MIEQIYLGFDDVCPASAFKNLGIFWQPLRISTSDETIYMVIDYNIIGAKNHLWFDTLKELLS